MGRCQQLTEREKGQIDAYHANGHSNRRIAELIKRSPKVINNYLKNPGEYGVRKPSGRPKKLSPRDIRKIIRAASNSTKGCRRIRKELGLNVSKDTIWRTIKASPNLVRQSMKKCPTLRPHHKAARLAFGTEHMAWVDEWNNVSRNLDFVLKFLKKTNYRWFGAMKKNLILMAPTGFDRIGEI